MARKDVDLVIRAKDEAAKVVDQITAAINEFIGASTDLTKSSGKTSGALIELGAAFGLLEKELRGVSVSGKLAGELDKATAASTRLKTEFVETQAAARGLARDLQKAEFATERLAAKAAGAAAAQAKQAAILEKQKKAQAELTASLAKATAERDKLARQETRLDAAGQKQSTRVEEIRLRYNRLAAEIAGTAGPTKTLQSRLESVNESLGRQTAKLADLGTRYQVAQTAIGQTGAKIAGLSADLAKANAAVAKQETVVSKIVKNYQNLQAAAKTAAKNQTEIAVAADRATDVLARQAQRIERAEQELVQLAVAAGKADVAMSELAARSGTALTQAFAAQRRAMLETKREWAELTAEAKKLSAEMVKIGPPTRQQATAFNQVTTAARAAKQSYDLQKQGLQQLNVIMQQTGSSVEQLRSRQQQFVGVLGQVDAGLDRIQQEARQTVAAFNELAGAAGRVSTVTRRISERGAVPDAAPINRLSDAYRRLYGETRLAMSWTQRLRGEVLSLVSAYGGIFGVITLLQRTVGAYQKLEAAQSRLNVSFEGNQGKVGQELDFIRRNANRLGIEFGTLADEYSKFTIATQGTVLEGEKTRKIFISVAEAARVAKLSNEDLQGVFRALTQIVSKGTVQMEELKGQLGDRLPGAVKLMADGMKVGTDELIKMLEAGEIGAEALIGFGEELDRRFGPGLADALKTTTTALGQFRNATFQALLAFGKAGFIDSFTKLLNNLTETLRSADFQAFSTRVSQAFGVLTEALGLAIKNFDLLIVAGAAFAGIKLTPFIVALAGSFSNLGGTLKRLGTIFAATRGVMAATVASTTGLVAATGVAAAGVRGLTLAMRTLLSTTGIGLVVTAVSVGIGLWATSADTATEALNRHQKIVDLVRDKYQKAGGSVKDWAKELKEVTALQAEANLNDIIKAAEQARKALDGLSVGTGVANLEGDALKQAEALRDLTKAFIQTGGDVDEFKDKIEEIAEVALDESITKYAKKILDVADAYRPFNEAVAQATDILTTKTKTGDEAAAAMKRLGQSVDDAGTGMDDASADAEKFRSSLQKINEILPEISAGLEEMKLKAELDAAFKSASNAARTMSELAGAVDAYNAALGRIQNKSVDSVLSGPGGGLVDKIIGIESGGNPNAKNPDSSATGLGQFISSTWLKLFKEHFPDRAATLTDAMVLELRKNAAISKQMVEIYARENAGILQKAGVAVNDAALYLAHFLGPQGAIAVMSASANTSVDDLLSKSAINSNASILSGKTAGEVIKWAQQKVGISKEELAVQQELSAVDQKRIADADKGREQTAERLTTNQLEIENQRLINEGKAREAEITKAIAEAKKADPNITAAEIEQIRAQTGALFDLKAVKDQDKLQEREAAALMQQINALLAQRVALEQQLKLAKSAGDNTKVQETETAIAAVNAQMDEAIAKARGMWEAIGGAAADTALIKLDTAALKAGNLAQKAQQNYIDWSRVGQLFASGLTNAFDQFAQAVANGEDVAEAAKNAFLQFASDFLRQIAQMIIQQAILNALSALGFGGGGGGLGGVLSSVLHDGGVAGRAGKKRVVNTAVFANAPRLHGGGVPGLRPGEVPAILKKREEVLAEDNPRNIINGGMSGGGQQRTPDWKIVNAFDTASFLEQGLNSKPGERSMLNFVRANAGAFKQALEG